jgi:para-aminobenzoate synthetase component 1
MTFDDINSFGKKREPFLFISDFKAQNIKLYPLKDAKKENIEFSINQNYRYKKHENFLEKYPVDFESYKKKFDIVQEHIKCGDTYLLNLTQPTKIKTNKTLKEIYDLANASYKLRFKDDFVCFSPESFVNIEDNKINTYPMKGTIDASIVNAKEKILSNAKEMAEHIMVVDLLRNDIGIVSSNVKVEEFRYIQKINAGQKELLQVSSHISGMLEDDWHDNLGDILKALLPAGSISGTPKKSTIDIIDSVEDYERGYFSGVFGVYDGVKFQSAVMIRFIEKVENSFMYKSGGGITCDSEAVSEYNEMLDKVYLP